MPATPRLFRLAQGVALGAAFIVPGVSGGALTVVFKLYEPLIRFFARPREDFVENVLFFMPVGIGGLVGVALASRVLGDFFRAAETQVIWFFVGCVLGVLPGLYRQAGARGRKRSDHVTGALALAVMGAFLYATQAALVGARVPTDGPLAWFAIGALMCLVVITPGLSTSNILIFLGIYGEMTGRIGVLDPYALIPMAMGGLACVLAVARLYDWVFEVAYAGAYHAIIGVTLASTAMIVPWGGKALEGGGHASYTPGFALACAAICACGAAFGFAMGMFQVKYERVKGGAGNAKDRGAEAENTVSAENTAERD